jgi:type III secretion protein T
VNQQFLWSTFGPILLTLPRIGTAVLVVPLFPASLFPTLLRGAVSVSLSLYLYPRMAATLPVDISPFAWITLAGKEALIGGLVGLAVGSIIWAFDCAGELLDFQIGFANAQIFDPFGGHSTGPVGALMTRVGLVLFVAGGGLQVLASLLFESFHLWPVESFYPRMAPLADFAGNSFRSLGELAVRLAAPAMLLLALVDLGFGLLGRLVPQLNVFFFTMPLKAALAAMMIALYLSYLADIISGQLTDLQGALQRLAPVFATH